jgi:hypothetical protein
LRKAKRGTKTKIKQLFCCFGGKMSTRVSQQSQQEETNPHPASTAGHAVKQKGPRVNLLKNIPFIGGSGGDKAGNDTSDRRYAKNILGTREEDEMNENIATVDQKVKTLHEMAATMTGELDSQNEQLDRMNARQKEVAADMKNTKQKIDDDLGKPDQRSQGSSSLIRSIIKKLL